MIAGHITGAFEADETGKASGASGHACPGHPVGVAAEVACFTAAQPMSVKEDAVRRKGMTLSATCAVWKACQMRPGLARFAPAMPGPTPAASNGSLTRSARKVRWCACRGLGPFLILSPALVLGTEDATQVRSAPDFGLAAA